MFLATWRTMSQTRAVSSLRIIFLLDQNYLDPGIIWGTGP